MCSVGGIRPYRSYIRGWNTLLTLAANFMVTTQLKYRRLSEVQECFYTDEKPNIHPVRIEIAYRKSKL